MIRNKENEMQVLTLRIPVEIHEKIRQLAFDSRISMNQLVGEILIEFLRDKKEAA